MNWTISSLLDWTTLYFTKHKIENPHLEAEILLAHALNIKRIDLYVQHERVLNEEELAAFKKLIIRRIKNEPIAHIIGYKPFISLDFIVSSDVLIPRPETEHVVEVVIDIIKAGQNKSIKILDIGTGSGAIAVSLAYYTKNSFVTATDVSPKALQLAKQNAAKHGVSDRIKLLQGNLFEPLNGSDVFDIIVSNPPYIPTGEIPSLQNEIKNFEPIKALDGGADGLDYYRKIMSKIDPFLKPEGYIVLEVGMAQAEEVSGIIRSKQIFAEPKIYEDYAGIKRVVEARRK
jgi:release factor glutamine methyltransferase